MLDTQLAPGEYRALLDLEINLFQATAGHKATCL
jgi:16S rRNA pseudouridine516 synthase